MTAAAQQQKVKDEPKATPPGQAKKRGPAAHANGNASKETVKKAKGKGATVDQLHAPAQTAPPPEQLVMPVATDAVAGNGQSDREEKEKGPKK